MPSQTSSSSSSYRRQDASSSNIVDTPANESNGPARSPTSPAAKTSMLSRLKSVFSSSTGSSSSSGSSSRGRERSSTTTSNGSLSPGRSLNARAKLANLRAYANGNVSSVDLSRLPHPPLSAISQYSAFSRASRASVASNPSSNLLLISPSASDGYLQAKASPLSLSPSQRSPLSVSYSPSARSNFNDSNASPTPDQSIFSASNGQSPIQAPTKSHRKATKSTATLPGWLSTPFSSTSSGKSSNRSIPESPSTPISLFMPPNQVHPHTDNEVTPKEKKRRTKNLDAMRSSGDHSLLATSRRAFSKSMDDLTTLAKGNMSNTASPVNKPRKSVDEQRRRRRESMKETLASAFLLSESERDAMPSFLPPKGLEKQHAQIQLPPSITLPGGLCIESTAALLGSGSSGGKRSPSGGSERSLPTTPSPGLAPPFTFPASKTSSFSSPTARQAKPSLVTNGSSTTVATIKASASRDQRRESQIVLLEGLVQRKTDYKSHKKTPSRGFPFYSSTSSSSGGKSPVSPSGQSVHTPTDRNIDFNRGWKPFYAILRGTKLYLYKIPPEHASAVKTIFESNKLSPNPFPRSPSSAVQLDEGRIQKAIFASPTPAYSLPVASSTVRPLSSTQRTNLFELQTEEGEIAILQTTSEEQLDSWTRALEHAGRKIADKRASYLEAQPLSARAESAEEVLRNKRAEVPKSTRLFGARLEDIITREGGAVPKVVDLLLGAIEERGLTETGIYRVSGETRVVQSMKAALDAGRNVDISPGTDFGDPHNLASCAKLWFRELPEIVPASFYSAFIEANGTEGYEERLYTIRNLIWQLPKPSFDLLKRLSEHLHLISENELENQMHASNLAIVFAPTVFKPPEGKDSYGILMTNLGASLKLVSSLITQQNWIFSYEEEAAEENIAESPVEDEELPFHEAQTSIYEPAPEMLEMNESIQREQTVH